VRRRTLPLGPAAPPWARRLYRRSIRVLVALTDPRSGALIAGERPGWDYVWPRDAASGAIALHAAGLHPEARAVARFLGGLHLDAARYFPDGDRVPGRPEAGDAAGWVSAALSAWHAGVSQIVVSGTAEQAASLLDVMASSYTPFTVTLPLDPAHAVASSRVSTWRHSTMPTSTRSCSAARTTRC
jgi:hypothetical protein